MDGNPKTEEGNGNLRNTSDGNAKTEEGNGNVRTHLVNYPHIRFREIVDGNAKTEEGNGNLRNTSRQLPAHPFSGKREQKREKGRGERNPTEEGNGNLRNSSRQLPAHPFS